MRQAKEMFLVLLKTKRIDISDEFTNNIYWQLVKDYPAGILKTAISEAMGTTYKFFEVAHLIELINKDMGNSAGGIAEKAWQEVLASAKSGGNSEISGRSAKALNSLGGLKWLSEGSENDTNWQRKDFIAIYENTPDQERVDFRCLGQDMGMVYLRKDTQVLLNH